MKPYKQFLFVFVLLCTSPVIAVERTPLSGEQLFRLIMSARQYESIEATLEYKGFQYSEDKSTKTILYEASMMFSQFHDRILVKQTKINYQSVGEPDSHDEIFLITPDESKYFVRDADGQMSGRVEKVCSACLDLTPQTIFWGNTDEDWEREIKNAPFSTTSVKDNGDYILEFPLTRKADSARQRYQIDGKSFMPVKREMIFTNRGEVTGELSSFVQIDGVWLPSKFMWYDTKVKIGGEYDIFNIKLNKIKSAAEIQFSFPLATRVEDKIRGVNYTVKAVSAEEPAALLKNATNGTPSTVNLPPSATNVQLADAAMKAQELLAKEKQATAGVPSVVPIRIYPSHVWVLPGKNEYVLSVNSKSDKTPGLVSHSIEANGLILNSVDDQISSSGKIRVGLERPAELKQFADGILTLEFADQKATIHFVAAPLE